MRKQARGIQVGSSNMHRHRIEYGKNVVDKFGNRYSQPFIMPVEKTQEECASERVRNPTRSQGQSRRLPSALYHYAGSIGVNFGVPYFPILNLQVGQT